MDLKKPRVILIVPANNTTMEPEIRHYCPNVDLVVARVPRPPRPLQLDDLPQYRESTLEAVRPLVVEGVDLMIYGCTSAGFLAGPEGDAEMVAALTELGAAPTVSTSTAILKAFAQAGIDHVDVVSPYVEWKNAALLNFLTSCGLRVERMASFNAKNPEELGRIQEAQVKEKCLEIASAGTQAMFIACSQLPSAGIIEPLVRELGKPVWSSVMAAGWETNRVLEKLRRVFL